MSDELPSPNNGAEDVWNRVLRAALALPGARIDRAAFLRKEFSKHTTKEVLQCAIEASPAKAGIGKDVIRRIATASIKWHRAGVSSVSFAAGLPGGWWMAGTVPADLTQFFWHTVVILQKLAYLYGWPELLGDHANLKVRNLSFGGAKVASSLDQSPLIHQYNALVILEIGGNDLLGGTSIHQFREDLDKMLTLVCVPHRRVAMIELPLPPFYNRFGMVQRDLAKSHGVTLIPKRYLAKTICTPGATVDGIHLSNAGHVLFARTLSVMLTQKN